MARLGGGATNAVFTRRVNWLLLILTLWLEHGLPLPDGRSAFAPCLACFFRRPLVGHASKMGEFSAFARDFALSVPVHGRESAFACRHSASVSYTEGTALRVPQMSLAAGVSHAVCK